MLSGRIEEDMYEKCIVHALRTVYRSWSVRKNSRHVIDSGGQLHHAIGRPRRAYLLRKVHAVERHNNVDQLVDRFGDALGQGMCEAGSATANDQQQSGHNEAGHDNNAADLSLSLRKNLTTATTKGVDAQQQTVRNRIAAWRGR